MSNHQPSAPARQLTDAWIAGVEAALQTTFQLQNASLIAGRSLLEHWETALEQGQQAVLDAVHQRLRPTTRLSETAQ